MPHDARRTFGTHGLETGTPINIIQRQKRHKNSATTMRTCRLGSKHRFRLGSAAEQGVQMRLLERDGGRERIAAQVAQQAVQELARSRMLGLFGKQIHGTHHDAALRDTRFKQQTEAARLEPCVNRLNERAQRRWTMIEDHRGGAVDEFPPLPIAVRFSGKVREDRVLEGAD